MSPTAAASEKALRVTPSPTLPTRGRETELRVLPGGRADDARPIIHYRPKHPSRATPLLPLGYRGRALRRLLDPRRPAELALLSVIRETYLAGAGTRAVEALMEAVGIAGTVPVDLHADADEWDLRVKAFQERPITGNLPYLMLIETPVLVRATGGARTYHIVAAVARSESGRREVVGFGVRPGDAGAVFWRAFFDGLRGRGLRGLQFVTSNPAAGLLEALADVYPAARWQRCREGFIADVLNRIPRVARGAVAASLRAALAQRDATNALHGLSRVQSRFEFGYPEVADALDAPLGSLLTYYSATPSQRKLMSSLKVLDPLLRELRQACQVIGIFPETRTALRLCGTILQEISDEWAARATPGRRQATAIAAWEARVAWPTRRVARVAVAA